MTIVVPNTASTFSAAASVPGASNCWAWVGFQTLTASGSCTWYRGSTCTSGSEMISISLIAQQSALFGPFNSPNGLYAAGVSGGCAIAWLKTPAGT